MSRRPDPAGDDAAIAAFIAEHGVTRCPPACVAPTTATLTAEAQAQHEARGLDPAGETWRQRQKAGLAKYWERRRAERV